VLREKYPTSPRVDTFGPIMSSFPKFIDVNELASLLECDYHEALRLVQGGKVKSWRAKVGGTGRYMLRTLRDSAKIAFGDEKARGYKRALGSALFRVAELTGSKDVEVVGGKMLRGEVLTEVEGLTVGEVKKKWFGIGETADLPFHMRLRRAFFWTDPPTTREGRALMIGIKPSRWPVGDVLGVAVRHVGGDNVGRELAGMKLWVSRGLMERGEVTKVGRVVEGIGSYEVYPGKVWVPVSVVMILNCLSTLRVGGDISWSMGKHPELGSVLASKEMLEEYADRAEGVIPGWKASLRKGFEDKGWVRKGR
jgi:hypothetical protein